MQDVLFCIGLGLFAMLVIVLVAVLAAALIGVCCPAEARDWWERHSMTLALWLIGERETPRQKSNHFNAKLPR